MKVAVVFNGPAGKGLIGELKADCSISFIFPLTVAVKSMKHGRGWEGSALVSDVAAGASMPRLSFFFFFFFTDSHRLSFDMRRFGQNQAESGCIGQQLKRPESALNHVGIAEIGFK